MLQVRCRLDLGEEPLGAERGGEILMQDFDGDAALVFEIAREVDGGHPALPELPLDAVAVGERISE